MTDDAGAAMTRETVPGAPERVRLRVGGVAWRMADMPVADVTNDPTTGWPVQEYVRADLLAAAEAERDYVIGKDPDAIGRLSVAWVCEDWQDEWAAWYKGEDWPLGAHRAASAFVAMKVRELKAERDAARKALDLAEAFIQHTVTLCDQVRERTMASDDWSKRNAEAIAEAGRALLARLGGAR